MHENRFRERKRALSGVCGSPLILLSDPHTITYMTGVEFPFVSQFPEKPVALLLAEDEPAVLICPYEYRAAAEAQGLEGKKISYGDSEPEPFLFISHEVSRTIRLPKSGSASIACEENHIPAGLFQMLRAEFPEARWVDAGPAVNSLRLIKTQDEADLLRTAAEQLEFGIIGALQHLEGSIEENIYTLSEFCERIRVHVYETGGTAGGLASAASGRKAALWYSLPEGKFHPGELVRIEATSRYRGWWAAASRMITIGKADYLQKRSYEENLLLKRKAIDLLRTGTEASSIFTAVQETACSEGISFRGEFGAGYGIGAAEIEGPRLDRSNTEMLQEGMCIVLAVYTEGPHKELICSKDTYYLSAAGPRCISSFHPWNSLYEITGFRSAH